MIDYQEFEGSPDARTLALVLDFYQKIFEVEPNEKVRQRLTKSQDLHFVFAFSGAGEPAGFKVGYRLEPGVFYSWIGGVLPAFRGQGIGSRLMEIQHEHCRRAGYRTVQTKTMNRWRNMLILNLKHGFEVVGTYTGVDGLLRIVLEKSLV